MSEKVEPALTAEEWADALEWEYGLTDYLVGPAERVGYGEHTPADLARLVALANAALPDTDSRKITREMVGLVKKAVVSERYAGSSTPDLDATAQLEAFATALESYLPPE